MLPFPSFNVLRTIHNFHVALGVSYFLFRSGVLGHRAYLRYDPGALPNMLWEFSVTSSVYWILQAFLVSQVSHNRAPTIAPPAQDLC